MNETIENTLIVTRNKRKEPYFRYINRIINSNNLTALNIKCYDIENNRNLSRIPNPTKKTVKETKKNMSPI